MYDIICSSTPSYVWCAFGYGTKRCLLSEITTVMNTWQPTPFYYLCSWLHGTVRILAGRAGTQWQSVDPEGNFCPPRILYQKRLLSALFDDAVSCQDCMASVWDKRNMSMEHWPGKPQVLEDNTSDCHFVYHKIAHGLSWEWTQASAMWDRRLPAWANGPCSLPTDMNPL